MREIRWREAAYVEDPEVEAYLARLGARLTQAAPATPQDLSFFAVRDASLNAFALPGGFIGVHSGLIISAQSESELASVLGHEIAHVTQRHIAQLVGAQGRTGLVMLASLIVAVLAAGHSSQAAEAALATGVATGAHTQLSYSRDFEREADRVGLQILDGSGFDVRGMPSFFERLQRNSRLYENNAPAYLRTHPLTSERIADIGNRTQQMRYRQVADSIDFRLVRAKLIVDGLPRGESVDKVEGLLGSNRIERDYARARGLLKSGQLEAAAALAGSLARALDDGDGAVPMVATLQGEILRAQQRWREAADVCRTALARFPDRLALRYGLAEAQLGAGQSAEAAAGARAALAEHGDDYTLWTLIARAETQAGNDAGRHRAQAEAYRMQGALQAAVEQLELAQRAAGKDFYEASAIDSRLREMRQLLREAKENARAGGG